MSAVLGRPVAMNADLRAALPEQLELECRRFVG
jgi:hypothetical protein